MTVAMVTSQRLNSVSIHVTLNKTFFFCNIRVIHNRCYGYIVTSTVIDFNVKLAIKFLTRSIRVIRFLTEENNKCLPANQNVVFSVTVA